jgi:23S rRNA (uracil1939-C5)-methyltransferase
MTDPILVTLEKQVFGGETMGHLDDHRPVFVPFALPGERVRLHLVEEKHSYARAELLEIVEASPGRIQPRCRFFGICGGCHYQHMPYASQLEVKSGILLDQLSRIGKVNNPPIQPVQNCPTPWNYRNQVQFHLGSDGRLGFQAPNSSQVVAVSECHLPEAPLNSLWPELMVEPGTGIQKVSLRLGMDDELLLLLESNSPAPPGLEVQAGVSVVHRYKGEGLVLAGDEHVHMEIIPPGSDPGSQKRSFQVSAGSFFQVNTRMAEALVGHLLEILPDRMETLLDVYCGVGLFSSFLAPRVQRLIAIEVSPSACNDFCINLDEFDHVELYEAPAEQVLPALQVKPDVILVDPPRAGLGRNCLQAILAMQPRILVYISCDPSTLARDTRHLLAAGYLLQRVTPFDLFPQTFHIESVSLFTQ